HPCAAPGVGQARADRATVHYASTLWGDASVRRTRTGNVTITATVEYEVNEERKAMAGDPRELYTREAHIPDLPEEPVPVLVHALQGSVDAGHAGGLLAEHLTTKLTNRRVATFDIDALLDYRSRRPVMTYEDGAWTTYDE